MSRKFWSVLSVVLVALLAITACAPVPAAPPPEPAKAAEAPAPAAAEPVTLTWAFWGSPEEAVSAEVIAQMTGGHDRLIRLALAHVGKLP